MEPHVQPLASPPVLAVVVTRDPRVDRLEPLLRALSEQDYPNLSVIVVDAANRVLDLPLARGAAFFVFCRDDVVPDPGAVRALVDAATEWRAAVVGPKFVAADDPRRLLSVGLMVDRVGTTLPLVERRELDQGQHDGVRRVFAVPAGFTLVRAWRFAETGGFDDAVDAPDDDLILSWRARAAGCRVLVAPAARVRRPDGPPPSPRHHDRRRLRAVLGCSSRRDLVRLVPQALALSLAQAVWGLVTLRPGRARAALGAWMWNLRRPVSLWRARRQVNTVRRMPDRGIHRLQARGLIRPRLRLRRMAGGDAGRAGADRDVAADVDDGPITGDGLLAGVADDAVAPWTPGTAVIATALAGVVLFGSRHLLTRFVPAVGELVAFPGGARDLIRDWLGGYRPVGLGSDTSAPTVAGVAGGLGAVLGGHLGLARTLLTVGLVPVGVLGAYRLLRPSASKPAQVAAAVAYAAVPLPYDGLATGRWSVVAAYAASPWLLGRLARAARIPPFSPDGPVPVAPRPLWQHVVATAGVAGLAGVLVPQAPALLALLAVGLGVGSLLAFQGQGLGRLLGVALGAAVGAAVLHLPGLVDVLRSRTAAEGWLGLERPGGGLDALDLLRFDTGPLGIGPLGFCLVGAAALPLLVGRDWRLGWAVRGWTLAVVCWALLWAHQQGHLDVRMPDPGVILAPGAAGLALAVASGIAAIELDVRGRSWRFGFRRLASALGVLALAAAAAPLVVASMDGWWDMPRGEFAGVMGSVDAAVAAEPSRVLWVGDPAILPGGPAWELPGGMAYTALEHATPGVADLWPATGLGASDRLGAAVRLAVDGRTSRLGRVLAPMGVQYVAVPRALAPASALERSGREDQDGDVGADAAEADPSAVAAPGAVDGLIDALDGQLDLEQVPVDDAIVLYRNVAFAPVRATDIDGAALGETSVAAMQHVDLTAASPVLVDPDAGRESYRGAVPDGATMVQASSASGDWVLEVGGRRAERTVAYGWANAFTLAPGTAGGAGGPDAEGAEAVLTHRTPVGRHLLIAGQGAMWLVVLLVVVRMRTGTDGSTLPPLRGARVKVVAAGRPDGPADGTDETATVPDEAPSPDGEPEPVSAGAAT